MQIIKACIFVGVRTANEAEKAEIIADLTKMALM